MSSVQLIVGLGNPGLKYVQTRHNAGFWFVNELARQYGVTFSPETKFLGHIARVQTGELDFWLLKPATYMNHSGQSIQALANFYKIPIESVLVVHDELDLDAGVAKLKVGGGHGGHNGLRSAMAIMGKTFLRLRLGIGHPGHRDEVVDYVLKAPSKPDRQAIDEAIYQASKVVPELVLGSLQKAMLALHSK